MHWVCDAISLAVLPVLLCQTRPVVGCLHHDGDA